MSQNSGKENLGKDFDKFNDKTFRELYKLENANIILSQEFIDTLKELKIDEPKSVLQILSSNRMQLMAAALAIAVIIPIIAFMTLNNEKTNLENNQTAGRSMYSFNEIAQTNTDTTVQQTTSQHEQYEQYEQNTETSINNSINNKKIDENIEIGENYERKNYQEEQSEKIAEYYAGDNGDSEHSDFSNANDADYTTEKAERIGRGIGGIKLQIEDEHDFSIFDDIVLESGETTVAENSAVDKKYLDSKLSLGVIWERYIGDTPFKSNFEPYFYNSYPVNNDNFITDNNLAEDMDIYVSATYKLTLYGKKVLIIEVFEYDNTLTYILPDYADFNNDNIR